MVRSMDNQQVVDVIIPYHERTVKLVVNAILSVVANPAVRHVIVVNDAASMDFDMQSIPDSLRYKVKHVRNDTQVGIAKSRNFGIRLATAPYIVFLDADDTYEPYAFDYALNILENMPDVAVVKQHVNLVGLPCEFANNGMLLHEAKFILQAQCCVGVFRHSVLKETKGFPEHELYHLYGGEDFALTKTLMERKLVVLEMNQPPKLNYVYHNNSYAGKLLRSLYYGEQYVCDEVIKQMAQARTEWAKEVTFQERTGCFMA